ncbi:MAG: hypothetical protein BGP06_06280 [Rhizobiales bacterium 65-9]|nr:MAG: hypothetical protein BGP06_06280 [Rhizobiales bacterium 65-9]
MLQWRKRGPGSLNQDSVTGGARRATRLRLSLRPQKLMSDNPFNRALLWTFAGSAALCALFAAAWLAWLY